MAHPLVEVVGAAAFSGVVIFAYYRVIETGLTKGAFVAFIGALALFMDPIRKFSQANVKLSQAKAAANRIFGLLDLEEEPDIFSECDLIIRKYPYAWDYDQEIGISRINNYVDTFKVNNKQSLDSQIEWCDITIYNTSSCGIIAMLSGRIAINVALHNMFYWDPLEKDGSKNAVIHCRSAFELKNTINKLKIRAYD